MAFLNYENKRGSGKKLKVHFDLPDDDDYPNDHQKHSSSSISSESSDSDDSDKDDNFDSKYGGYGSPVWSVTQSPPVQHMSPNGYDPNRIPSGVFSARPASPMEWSVASNESLFSLHLGNNSFSRDHAFGFNKSGELPRTSDLPTIPSPTALPLPPVQEASHNKNMERHSVSSDSSDESVEDLAVKDDHKKTSNETVVKDDSRKTETSAEVEVTTLGKTPDDHSKEPMIPSQGSKNYNTSVSYRSVESDISTRSFQFPILTADGGRSSSITVDSEKHEKDEKQQEQEQPENPEKPPGPETEKTPKQGGRNWCCFCFCSPCY
ncbi:hypothetical protein SESBI_44672 [Sesbania bispinosa]|nr:hypothetical protein SESBI_44672 [Sesbania bispinosa]